MIICPGHWESGKIRVRDWFEVRSRDGGSRTTYVMSIDMVHFVPGQKQYFDAHNGGALLLSVSLKAKSIGEMKFGRA